MDDQRRLLWLFLGVFTVLSFLLAWSLIYRSVSTFKAGTRPDYTPASLATPPKLPPVRSTDPARGSTSTDAIVIVEFADFTCSYCRATEPELKAILDTYPAGIRHVWRDMPVASDRPDGILAASAGRCANDQGMFWEMHDEMFKLSTIDIASLQDVAARLKLDVPAFNTCLQSGRHVVDIQSDIQIAKDHGLTGAPTFFIGNQTLTGYIKAGEFQWALLKARLF
jgi:protein-disulfide isomerase